MKTIVEKFLNKLSLDRRITDGVFNIENNEHLDILQETLQKMGVIEEEAIDIRNKVTEGKYPDRQAFNVNGILVTFPTTEYKQRAIQRGTHFEINPKKQQPNVDFVDKTAPETKSVQSEPTEPAVEPAVEPTPPPQITPTPSIAAPVEVPTPATKTVSAPVMVLPPGELKRREDDEQKKAQAEYVEKLLKTEPPNGYTSKGYTLEEAKQFDFYNKGYKWYTTDGVYVGIQCFDETLNRIVIKDV